MPRYNDIKTAILEEGRFLRDTDDDLLKRWFWAGVAAAVQVGNVAQPNSNVVLAEVRILLNLWDKAREIETYGTHDDWDEIFMRLDKQMKKVSERFS